MSDRLHCPGCGIPTIEGGLDTTEEELYCNRCVEELERNMSTNKPAGGAQFTPGPWQISAIQNEPEKMSIIDADMCFVAEVWQTYIDGESRQQAHATLIAAAPAMYEALQALLALIGDEDLPDNGELSGASICDFARSALAQAEGRQG